ncbi:ATP-binding protein [Paenibacillus sp. PL2-23]|uniref:ATP-binding protein n=1 Tax=Paenibacillus sp. PL2-23 TaxID=2100729 RepID=UPI0030F819F6
MHVVSFLASDHLLILDWSIVATFVVCLILTTGALGLLYFVPRRTGWHEYGAAILFALAPAAIQHLSILSSKVQSYHIQKADLACSLAVSLAGALAVITLNRKGINKWILSFILGMSNLIMHQIGIHSVTIEYRELMTTEKFNEYLLMFAFVLGLSTLFIISFSLVSWISAKKLTLINSRYKLLVENSMDMIALIKDGNWEYVNPSGLRLFEASGEGEMLGMAVLKQLERKHHDRFLHWLADEAVQDEHAVPVELEWTTLRGKHIYTEAVRTRTSLYGSTIEQVIIRDISERKRNEELMIKTEKLSIAGQLAAGIAHEIRNPLTSLKGFMQLISTGRVQNNRYYGIMNAELIRIETIISELLMLSKPQAYEYACLDIRKLMKETVAGLSLLAKQNGVQLDYGQAPPVKSLWVLGVDIQLRQVLFNIMKNAIESMLSGGTVRIRLALENAEMVSILIQDEGIGIPEEQLANIGQPFYTTKDKGTGLGLMVTYKIIENHEGQITAESQLGIGTTFSIKLPYRKPCEEQNAELDQSLFM